MHKTETIIIRNFADITYTPYPNKNNPNHYFIEGIKFWDLKSDKAKKEGQAHLLKPPKNLLDVHIRLYLLSTLVYKPGEINMEGVLGILPTLYWVNGRESYTPEEFKFKLKRGERPAITPDKFPKIWMMCDIAEDVRIEDPNSVRYGAYLSPGTVVKSPGIVNANSGTLGPSLIEGRIPFGTLIGANSHIGAGSGIVGILSSSHEYSGLKRTEKEIGASDEPGYMYPNKKPITIGENCLIGANAECGISLGKSCTIESCLSVNPGTKLRYYRDFSNNFNSDFSELKASDLEFEDNLVFLRHGIYGYVAAINILSIIK